MRTASAFLVPSARPAVIVLLLVTMPAVGVMLLAVTDPDFPTRAVHVGILAVLGFAGNVGFLAGGVLRELQHCRFTWVLPGFRRRSLTGFLTLAAVVSGLTAFFVRLHHPDLHYVALLALGLAAFCLAGVLVDRRSHVRTLVHATVALALIAESDRLGEWCSSRPFAVAVAAGSLVLTAICLRRAFGSRAFRAMPFLPLAPLPGAFATRQTVRYERDKLARRSRGRQMTMRVPRGDGLRDWIRRGNHENVKGRPLAMLLKEPRALLMMAAIVLMHALGREGNGGFWLELARTIYHVVLQPPFAPPQGEDFPRIILPLFLAAVGGALTVTRAVPLGARLLYPVSRTERLHVVYRSSLQESLRFLAFFGGCLLAMALLAGAYAGYPLRLDFVPLVVRAVAATGAILPAFQWLRLKTTQSGPHGSHYAIVGFTFAVIGATIAVTVWCALSPRVLTSPVVELPVLLALFAGPQWLYYRRLATYYRSEDLA